MTVAIARQPRTAPRSTTGRTLRRLRAAAFGLTVLVLVSSWYVFGSIHSTIALVETRTAPAMLEAAVARSALAEADYLALKSFRTGEAKLAGPGARYQNQIALTSQSLAQVAEDNVAGVNASKRLQLVEGLLVAYTGLIAQAEAHHRQGPASATLAAADLWYASSLLHMAKSGILVQLDELLQAQRGELNKQVTGSSVTFGRVLLLVVPIVALLVLLVLAQLFLRRTFRRSVNMFLATATILLAVSGAIPVLGIVAQQRLVSSAAELGQLIDTWQARTADQVTAGQRTLMDLLTEQCQNGCGSSVARFAEDVETTSSMAQIDDRQLTGKVKKVNDDIKAAGGNGGLELLVPAGMVVIGLLVMAGFHDRIEEYRYQPR